ncbi:MAG: ATP-binding protein involved in chromosome partitioning [Zhongshania aliphaticivorans]|jgi:ATP-binding protein involved in chromosome partitioning|uniref:iron-sulfur cluster carrier protein ApbC n=1 Tax=Zhongshania aliphaticivorans TaxID=1470434 RepID=UPI0039E4F974
MATELESQVREALMAVVLPGLSAPLAQFADIHSLAVKGGRVDAVVELGFAARSAQQSYEQSLSSVLKSLDGIADAAVRVTWKIAPYAAQQNIKSMENVRNIIAVASGKGGVGKSTTAVNLALALVSEGARVGLLDADIYGPSVQMMLGVANGVRPKPYGTHYLLPIEAHGVQSMSMGYLVTEDTPMVWRGPMATGALQQLLNQTYWQDLDYLIIDMPPGTGDIQLTLSQKVPVSGAVIVTTPQDIALLDAKKGIEMFRKVSVPVLGIVENMAVHICSECGHHEHVFGAGGGARMASNYQVPMLGSLPLSMQIRSQADCGKPVMVADPSGDAAALYRSVAIGMTAELAKRQRVQSNAFPNISISDD